MLPGARLRVLFIGNSLTYFNGGLDRRFAALTGHAVAAETAPGASLRDLWQRGGAQKRIASAKWDVVCLQEDLPETCEADFCEHCRKFVIAARDAGARPILFMTWPYKRLPRVTLADVVGAHRKMANELGVDVMPVGLAFERARAEARAAEERSLKLIGPDNEHPSPAGTYLAALTLSAILGEKSPTAESWRPQGVSAAQAKFLCRVATDELEEWARAAPPASE